MKIIIDIFQLFAMVGIMFNDLLAIISISSSFILFISTFFTNAPIKMFGEIATGSLMGLIGGSFFQLCMLITRTMPEKIGIFIPMQPNIVSGLLIMSSVFLMARFWLQKNRKFAFNEPIHEKSRHKTTARTRIGNVTNIFVGNDVNGNVIVGDNNKVNNFEKVASGQQYVTETQNTLDLWSEVKRFRGETLCTLDQRKPFLIVEVTDQLIIVRPLSTNVDRPISREGIEAAMQHLKITGQLSLQEIEEKFVPYNPVYVSAILATFPHVRYSIRPTRLWIINKE